MIYTPGHYKEERLDLVKEVIRRNEFAMVITVDGGEPFVSHLPLLLDPSGENLIGHCARANPQWRHFSTGQSVTAVFSGPHAYISPAWYQEKPENVPTWNYVAVHVRTTAEIIDEPMESYAVLSSLVEYFETKYKTGWCLPQDPNVELLGLLKGIVSFRLKIESIDAKFKLSQKQNEFDRQTVISQLPNFMAHEGLAVAEYMNLVKSIKRDE